MTIGNIIMLTSATSQHHVIDSVNLPSNVSLPITIRAKMKNPRRKSHRGRYWRSRIVLRVVSVEVPRSLFND